MTTTRFFSLVLMITTTIPAIASAQLEMATDESYAQPPPQVVAQPQPAPVVVVQQPAQPVAPIVQQPVVQYVEPVPDDYDLSISMGSWVEMMSLDELELSMVDPEISALTGVSLADWQGLDALREPVVGGGMFSVGMRMNGWLRGPEVRFMVGGTDIESPWVRAPDSDLELQIRGAVVLRTELALGIQAPLGIFRPYLQARVSVGGAWIDVAVQDARLGTLGTETVDQVLCEVGGEAGLAFLIADGVEMGFGIRASVNQFGGEAIGGIFTINFVEDDQIAD